MRFILERPPKSERQGFHQLISILCVFLSTLRRDPKQQRTVCEHHRRFKAAPIQGKSVCCCNNVFIKVASLPVFWFSGLFAKRFGLNAMFKLQVRLNMTSTHAVWIRLFRNSLNFGRMWSLCLKWSREASFAIAILTTTVHATHSSSL